MAKNKIKILVIDDDPKVSWILSEGLSKKFEFVSARDGIEGIQMVSTEKPDLILLDIKMPGMNGMEVLEKLNKLEINYAHVPKRSNGADHLKMSSSCNLK